MIKRFIILFLAVTFLYVFASCADGSIAKESEKPDILTFDPFASEIPVLTKNNETQDEILALINNETDNSDLITQSFDINLLINNCYSGSLEEINKIAKIECIRKVNDLIYTIYRANDGGKYFIFYEYDKKSKSWGACGSWYFLKPLIKEDFSKVKVDKTTALEISEIDPTTVLYPTGGGFCSEHILSDRSIVAIYYNFGNSTYEGDCIVESIYYGDEWLERESDNTYRKILDIDWPT